jgi:class 3 adenylate cyclase
MSMLEKLKKFAKEDGDSGELAFRKLLILLIASSCSICGVIWATLYYFVFGFGVIAFLPFLFFILVGTAILIAHYSRNYKILIYVQLACITWISAFIQWSIGGMSESGFVIAWSFLGPIGALIFLSLRQSILWMIMFLFIVVVSVVFEPALLGYETHVSDSVKIMFYIMNIGTASTVVFAASAWFAKTIQNEKSRSENLLLNILPASVAEELKLNGKVEPKYFDNATVLFTDFKGFTKISATLSAKELVDEINFCFCAFDEITSKYHLEKIKTIGDAYMAVGGGISNQDCPPSNVVQAGLEMQEFIVARKILLEKETKKGFEMRLGIHSGPIVAGVVGLKKFQYDIWGDTVNTASRMESNGEVGKVNISEVTYELVKNDFDFEYRDKLPIKGKEDTGMYFVIKKIN